MKKVALILRTYLKDRIPLSSILISFILAALAVYFQYRYGLKNTFLGDMDQKLNYLFRSMVFFGTPLIVFLAIWKLISKKESNLFSVQLMLLLFVTLLSFALRIGFFEHSSWVSQNFENWNYGIRLTNAVILGPIMCTLPVIWWLWVDRKTEKRVYGCSLKGVDWKAYFILLGLMLPLIIAAASTSDFIQYYPKVARLFNETYPPQTSQVILYEFFYGLDFVYIEFFFRGFLVIAFARFLGPASIPFAALMYCTIHFGKPLGETISSWFGGMILGILVMETRSIAGGIVVHMGIAWLMELGGWLGRSYDL